MHRQRHAKIVATVGRALLVWTDAGPRLSLGNFAALFGDPRIASAALNTLVAGTCTTVLSLLLGFTLAFLVARTDMPGRRWLETGKLLHRGNNLEEIAEILRRPSR